MLELFDTLKALKQNVVRNIVNLLPSRLAFADLLEQPKAAAAIADKVIAHVMQQEDTSFHYTAAIGYPFDTDAFMYTRYSDGSFPIWYGAMDLLTTIHETVHHMIKQEMAVSGIEKTAIIVRERVVYDVFCEGILVDLTAKKKAYPQLTAVDYHYTQKIGKQLYQQGLPGLLAPSARHQGGVNVNIFKNEILSKPEVKTELSYRLYPGLKKVKVYQKGRKLKEISW